MPARTYTYDDVKMGKKDRILTEWADMRIERALLETVWEDIQFHVDPVLLQMTPGEDKEMQIGNSNILDSTPIHAADASINGLQNNITPMNNPWFRLWVGNRQLRELGPAKEWLYNETEATRRDVQMSNFYSQTPAFYENWLKTGTAAMMAKPDPVKLFTCETFTTGSYWISNDAEGMVDKFVHESEWTVRQIVDEFCTNKLTGQVDLSNLTEATKKLWENAADREKKLKVCLYIGPNNEGYDREYAKMDSKYQRYAQCYWESLADEKEKDKFLREEGMEKFNVFACRAQHPLKKAYGWKWPLAKALPDIKQLFKEAELKNYGMEMHVKPPMNAPGKRENNRVFGTMPDFINFVGDSKEGFRPSVEVKPDIAGVVASMDRTERILNVALYADIFRRLALDNRRARASATEVSQQYFEDLKALTIIYGFFEIDFLKPFIEYVFYLRMKYRKVAPPPDELKGPAIDIQFISVLAQAVKMGEISSKERFVGFVLGIAKGRPDALDVPNWDQIIQNYAEQLSMSPDEINADDKIAMIREAKAQIAQQQQQAEAMAAAASAARDLSGADLEGNNALKAVVESEEGIPA